MNFWLNLFWNILLVLWRNQTSVLTSWSYILWLGRTIFIHSSVFLWSGSYRIMSCINRTVLLLPFWTRWLLFLNWRWTPNAMLISSEWDNYAYILLSYREKHSVSTLSRMLVVFIDIIYNLRKFYSISRLLNCFKQSGIIGGYYIFSVSVEMIMYFLPLNQYDLLL